MTSIAVDPFRKTARVPRRDPQWKSLRVGQIVAAQAAVAGLLAALGHGPVILAAASTIGGVVVIVAFAQVRGRWLHTWLAVGIRYATRRHSLPAKATSTGLMRFLAPDVAAAPDAAFVDADGLVTVFEVDGPLVASESAALPDLAGLVYDANDPSPGRDPFAAVAVPASPLVRIELLVTAAAAPTSGLGSATAASYRQLTGDRVPAQCRTFVVLRVLRPPGWSDADLRPTMSGATRRVAKRLGPHRRLDHEGAATTLAELAHHDTTSRVDERWAFVVIGGLCQATYRVTLPAGNENTARAVHRLLTLPTAATTISVSPPWFAPFLAIRLAAGSPQQLERADQALRQLAAAERATVRRLDGEHRIATAETLLVGGHSGSLGL
ncbi:MAG TPA: hypothetical protein VK659_15775 [Asanoa sp.]|nr:hypothetical protein [Asanoa sp.]